MQLFANKDAAEVHVCSAWTLVTLAPPLDYVLLMSLCERNQSGCTKGETLQWKRGDTKQRLALILCILRQSEINKANFCFCVFYCLSVHFLTTAFSVACCFILHICLTLSWSGESCRCFKIFWKCFLIAGKYPAAHVNVPKQCCFGTGLQYGSRFKATAILLKDTVLFTWTFNMSDNYCVTA